MDVKFYKDKTTKEVSMSLTNKFDDNLLLLKANSTDAATEKHVPCVTMKGNTIHVVIGSTVHPMTAEHHIEFIVLVTDKKAILTRLDPTEKPETDFIVDPTDRPVAVYEYCNLHGLWVKEF
ncbi:MAG: desulfoferrodoxin family protein [Bacilli bacterium]